ncbi:Carboxylesterase family protein [uncultured archaeon]|nr:Carboxylesterase family protein [uncultured archaeon]
MILKKDVAGKTNDLRLLFCVVFAGLYMIVGCTMAEHTGDGLGTVKTEGGYISGIDQNGLSVYLGIPYAAPPTGDLRWRPPEAARSWEGVYKADKFGPSCPQAVSKDFGPEWYPGNMSEDCLTLNIWTPAANSNEKLPVMVFIYGGAYIRGSSALPLYNGTALARKGVVVVTFNYRVGVLGYMAHPQLSGESPDNTSGNYALLDQEAALRWVQRNIAAFGGDPERVTIFGESAGAANIVSQLAIPRSKGLYSQAIIESGGIWSNGPAILGYRTRADAEEYGRKFAESLGCSGPDALQKMRNMSAFDLVNSTPNVWNSTFWGFHNVAFKPTIDGWLIPEAPQEIFRKGRQNPVPLMIGSNADEGTLLAANTNMTAEAYWKFLQDSFGPGAIQMLARYPARNDTEVQYRMERIATDIDFALASRFIAGSMASLNQSTYLYKFTYVLPGQPNGAYHTGELYFVFRPSYWKADSTSSAVSDYVMDLWTRFAKTGNPNGGINVTWPQYSNEKDQYLDIGEAPVVKTGY